MAIAKEWDKDRTGQEQKKNEFNRTFSKSMMKHSIE